MTFDSLQPVLLMLLYLSDGIFTEAVVLPPLPVSPSPLSSSTAAAPMAAMLVDPASTIASLTPAQPPKPVVLSFAPASSTTMSTATTTAAAAVTKPEPPAPSAATAATSPAATVAPAPISIRHLPTAGAEAAAQHGSGAAPASNNQLYARAETTASTALTAPTTTTTSRSVSTASVVPSTPGGRPSTTVDMALRQRQRFQQQQQQQLQQQRQQHQRQQYQNFYQPAQSSNAANDIVGQAASTTSSPDYAITNVTAQIGTNAYLPCKVNKIFNKSVSWVRMRDDHILTVDRLIFIADERFNAFHPSGGGGGGGNPDDIPPPSSSSSVQRVKGAQQQPVALDSWQLQIKYVQARDEGEYECQVSSEPKVSAKIYLHVVVPRTELLGETSRYVKEGSQVSLHCIVTGAIDPPLYIIWYHGSAQIFPDDRRGWRMDINRESVHANPKHGTIGTLLIPALKKRDSGNYTCVPSNSQPISTQLHVINGEYSASAITSAAAPLDRRLPALVTGAGCRNSQLIAAAGVLCALLMAIVQQRQQHNRQQQPQQRRRPATTST